MGACRRMDGGGVASWSGKKFPTGVGATFFAAEKKRAPDRPAGTRDHGSTTCRNK